MRNITDTFQNLWSSDEIIVLVLASLGIQIFLIFLAPLRKRSTRVVLTLTLWLLYLTADNVATLALGNISKENPATSGVSSELTVLWAPFLLVHLGGPDTITSYSIEDNELWWRHLWGLLNQVIITVYIFIQSPPTGLLWIPTIFVFIPGLIKFGERTHALRLASKDYIKNKILSELRPGNKTMKAGNKDNNNTTSNPVPANRTTEGSEDNTTSNPVPANRTTEGSEDNTTSNPVPANQTTEGSEANTTSNPVPANRTTEGRLSNLKGKIMSVLFPAKDTRDNVKESKDICEAYDWFNIFKRLLVDVTFPADQLMNSQDRFADVNSTEALNLVAIELSFLYDILHTKAVHMHTIKGRVLRCFSLVSIIAALVVFHHLDMHKYVSKDIIVTYILFGVGLSLEVIAIVLLVFSKWMVVTLTSMEHSNCFASCITAMVEVITFRKGIRRWANTIGQYNLVGVCLRDRDTKLATIMRTLKIKHMWDNICESKLIPLPKLLQEIMFTEAKRRAQNVHIYNVLKEARSYRGNKTLERHNKLETLEGSMKMEFDESIILWHVATDICYYEEFNPNQSNKNGSDDTEREVSWKTSNYMIYLLTQQQSMMQLGYGKTRFEAICAVVKEKFKSKKGKLEDKEARKELMKEEVAPPKRVGQNGAQESVLKKIWACLRCLGRRKAEEDKLKVEAEADMGEELLKKCRKLANELKKLEPEIKWKLISETWMEMLGYAAIHCDSYQHAKSLSRGGELLTHLWLLMSQLGVVEEHKIQQFESGSV